MQTDLDSKKHSHSSFRPNKTLELHSHLDFGTGRSKDSWHRDFRHSSCLSPRLHRMGSREPRRHWGSNTD